MKKYIIKLSSSQIRYIKDIIHKGNHLASVRNRAQVLLLIHKGLSDENIASILDITDKTVRNIRRKFRDYGFKKAIYGFKRSGRPFKFTSKDEVELISLACSNPPEGNSRWTLELLKNNMKKDIGRSTVGLMLKKIAANRGDIKCGVLVK